MKILSLGAGVQSSCIAMMAAQGEMERPDAMIFSDTGDEPKAVYEWLNEFLKPHIEKSGIPLYIVRNGNLKEDALKSQVRGLAAEGTRCASLPYFVKNPETGQKGMLRRQCTGEYKIIPVVKKQRELLGYKPRQRIPAGSCEVWKGISLDELRRASVSNVKWYSYYYPLIEMSMTRYDCKLWFKERGHPIPPRSSCLRCPYHSNQEWRNIKINSPEEWKDVVEFDKTIRNTDKTRGQLFLHSGLIPLDEVDLTTAEDHGQGNLFDMECMGMCGL